MSKVNKTAFSRIYLPYQLKRTPDGYYWVLNREYKPVGFSVTRFVDYDCYPVKIKIKGITPKVAAKLDARGRDNIESIYLYNDGCPPVNLWDKTLKSDTDQYFERLKLLMRLSVEVNDSQTDDKWVEFERNFLKEKKVS